VNVGSVAKQESSAFSKAFCHTVVDAIGRKPIYLFYFDLEILNDARADVLKLECISMLGAFVAHRPNQPHTALAGKWEYGKKIGVLKVNVEFPVNSGATGLDIRDIEETVISAPGKSGAHRLAYNRMRAIAPRDVVRLARFFLTIRSPKAHGDTVTLIMKIEQFSPTLNRQAKLL
jgi:hypothetical protein